MSLITIAVQCHNYQKRLCWMLSSLYQQTKPGLLSIDVAHVHGNGTPSTESVLGAFIPGLDVRSSRWDDRTSFQKRGLVRNAQLTRCATTWLLFADCDMIYHPEYFEHLASELQNDHACATYMLSSGRMSSDKDLTNELVNSTVGATAVLIANAFQRAQMLPLTPRSNVGAGFAQLINMKYAPHEGYYVDPERNPDWDWGKRMNKCRSDLRFRRRIASASGPGRKLPFWFTENVIHLNHDRDRDFGYHIEAQR